MFNYLAELTVKSVIKRNNLDRQKKFLAWDHIEKIALLVDGGTNINKSALDKFIQKTNKHVEVYYIDLKAKEPLYNDWQCFSKKDQSFLKLPKSKSIAELSRKKFDLVINTSTEFPLFSSCLTSNLVAYVKCGTEGYFDTVDLIVKKNEPFDLINYLEDVIKYLKMIRPAS